MNSSDIASTLTPTPARLSVTVWKRPGGGSEVWLDALALDADGDTLAEAATALVAEIHYLVAGWQTQERLRQAPNWRQRGALIAHLATLTDGQITALFVFRHRVEPTRPLDG